MNADYEIRKLQESDYKIGYMDCVNELTDDVYVSESDFLERMRLLDSKQDYYNAVVYDRSSNKIIGCGTLFIEYKFIRGCVNKAHIEDIVVRKANRKCGVGKCILEHLVHQAKIRDCYKISLVCDKKNTAFYEKCGFKEKETEMVIYIK